VKEVDDYAAGSGAQDYHGYIVTPQGGPVGVADRAPEVLAGPLCLFDTGTKNGSNFLRNQD
jgi:hypothetical protein